MQNVTVRSIPDRTTFSSLACRRAPLVYRDGPTVDKGVENKGSIPDALGVFLV